jgi:integrase
MEFIRFHPFQREFGSFANGVGIAIDRASGWYTFRHTFISLGLTRCIAEATIRSWVGHVDEEILRLYTHVSDAASRAFIEQFSDGSAAAITPPTGRKEGAA